MSYNADLELRVIPVGCIAGFRVCLISNSRSREKSGVFRVRLLPICTGDGGVESCLVCCLL